MTRLASSPSRIVIAALALLLAWLPKADANDTGIDPVYGATVIPSFLIGVWAKGGKCGTKTLLLRITPTTLQFASKPPVRFYFGSGIGWARPDDDYLMPDPKDNRAKNYGVLTYNENVRLLFHAGDESDPNHIYFPCFGKPVTWPP